MAGYFNVVTETGALISSHGINQVLAQPSDVYEVIEEMYGMIWELIGQSGDEGMERLLLANSRYIHGIKDISPGHNGKIGTGR